jgi:hypothetical protein
MDHRIEFEQINGVKASCKEGFSSWSEDPYADCSGLTDKGMPVTFHCDPAGCEWSKGIW